MTGSKPIFTLLRPKQWTKNLLVFAAPLFTGQFAGQTLGICFLAFVAMCLASSTTYIVNDLRDAERDRNHPKKKDRPLASGAVTPPMAMALALVTFLGSISLGFKLGLPSLAVIGGYFVIQATYNLWLKRVPIADVFLIGLGFVLRAVLGAVAISAPISGWLLFCTMALALMLGFAKRRDEFIRMGEDRSGSRESLEAYTRPVLDMMVGLFAATAMLSYGIYSIESPTAEGHPALIGTTIFVWYGIARYLFLVLSDGKGEEPETILVTDPHIVLSVLAFLIAAAIAVSNVFTPDFIAR